MKNARIITSLSLLLWMAACHNLDTVHELQGGTQAGNPHEFRQLVGQVPADEGNCIADEMVATSLNLEVLEITVGADCSFIGILKVGESYGLELVHDNEHLASILFALETTDDLSPLLSVTAGNGPIDLGLLRLERVDDEVVAVATPTEVDEQTLTLAESSADPKEAEADDSLEMDEGPASPLSDFLSEDPIEAAETNASPLSTARSPFIYKEI